LVGSNQGNYFENATACSKRSVDILKSRAVNGQQQMLAHAGSGSGSSSGGGKSR